MQDPEQAGPCFQDNRPKIFLLLPTRVNVVEDPPAGRGAPDAVLVSCASTDGKAGRKVPKQLEIFHLFSSDTSLESLGLANRC